MTLGFGIGNSTEQGERTECPHCHKYHYGTCRLITEGCFRCGSTCHLIVNCLRGFGTFRNPQGSSSRQDKMYLHRLVIGIEGEVVQGSKEEVLHQKP